MLDSLEDLYLSLDPLDIVHVLDQGLLEDFNRYFTQRSLMLAKAHLTKSSFAKFFSELVFTDHFWRLFLLVFLSQMRIIRRAIIRHIL